MIDIGACCVSFLTGVVFAAPISGAAVYAAVMQRRKKKAKRIQRGFKPRSLEQNDWFRESFRQDDVRA